MIKSDVIKRIVESLRAEIYLEVGLAQGKTFSCQPMPPLRLKIGVNPNINEVKLVNLHDIRNCICKAFSDDFFRLWETPLRRMGVDVVFIDGGHTWGQSERDVSNSLKCLTDKGIIVLHDSSPLDELMATPASSYEHFKRAHPKEHGWCGDVWKTIVCLRSLPEFERVNIFTLDIVTGLTIVSRGERVSSLPLTREQIKKLTYRDLNENRGQWLNFKPLDYFEKKFLVSGVV